MKYIIEIEQEDTTAEQVERDLNELLDYADSTIKIVEVMNGPDMVLQKKKVHCCDFNKASMWHHDTTCKNYVVCY